MLFRSLIVPAAAPPLGVTARILIALVMAALGAATGVLLALRINRPRIVVRERKRTAASPGIAATSEASTWPNRTDLSEGPARRPISAHEELGDALDSAGPLAVRRRSLAIEQEVEPFQPQELAPLPGGELPTFDIAATRPETRIDAMNDPLAAPLVAAPLDLGAFPAPAPTFEPEPALSHETPQIFGVTATDGHLPGEFVRAAGFKASVFENDPAVPLFAEPAAAEVVQQPAMAFIEPVPVAAPDAAPVMAAEPLPAPAGLGMNDLALRLQESMARRRAAKNAVPAAPKTAEVGAALAQAANVAPQNGADPVLGEPGFVPPPPIAVFAEAAAAEPPVIPGIQAAPIAMPAALRPLAFDALEDEDHGDLASLGPRHLTMAQGGQVSAAQDRPTTPAAIPTAPEAEPAPNEGAFAALSGIAAPHREFVRIEEVEAANTAIEPVVIFPGQMVAAHPPRPFDAPRPPMPGTVAQAPVIPSIDPAEAELALRSALANLQRISGAA